MSSIEPTRDQFTALVAADLDGPVEMLNLLRYREVADYSAAPQLAPDQEISGEQAYERYAEAVGPFLSGVGGEVRWMAQVGPTVIGPEDESWDAALLVRYPSRDAFVAMATDPDYLEIAAHRTAALADSRLIATVRA